MGGSLCMWWPTIWELGDSVFLTASLRVSSCLMATGSNYVIR